MSKKKEEKKTPSKKKKVVIQNEEVAKEAVVVRPENIVPPVEVKEDQTEKIWMKHTKPHLTKFERTRILATRCAQLQGGAPLNLTVDEIGKFRMGDHNYEDLARMELAMGRIPFIIERVFPGLDAQGNPRVVRIPVQDLS